MGPPDESVPEIDSAVQYPGVRGLRATLWGACALIVIASIAVAATSSWSELRVEDLELRPWWLATAIVTLGAFQLGAALLWRSLVHSLGTPLAFWPAMIAWHASMPARYAPTGLLMPVVRGAMAEPHGVAQRVCLASVVYEIALSIVGSVVVAAGFVLTLPALRDEPARWGILVLPVVALAALHPAIFSRAANAALRRAGRSELPVTIRPGRLLTYALAYAALFVVGGFSLLALVEALHPIGAADAPVVIGAFAAGCALSTIAFVLPGGLGAREAATVVALAPAMATAIAVAIVVAFRLMQIAVEVPLAIAAAAMARRTARGHGAAR